MRHTTLGILFSLTLFLGLQPAIAQQAQKSVPKKKPVDTSTIKGGYPNTSFSQKNYDQADLNRAIEAYRFFYPSVSGLALIKGNEQAGLADNKTFGYLDTKPHHMIFTANADTPYGPIPMSLANGPMVLEVPAGALIGVVMDIHQRWVADIGLPGPDAGKGGKHLILPMNYKGEIPSGYHVWKASSNRLLVAVRGMPINGDVQGAINRIQSVKVRPLKTPSGWSEPKWINLTDTAIDMTPLKWEKSMKYWEMLHEIVDTEPIYEGYRNQYGNLAALGIVKGKVFKPDARLRRILEQATKTANDQMRVQAFADRRPDRVVWHDRKWEWVSLRFEDGDFNTNGYVDLEAREKWFYQAIVASPAMFRRAAGSGSVYWLGQRDKNGNFLDGGKTYRLVVPQPVPAKLFWSVTVYDTETRSQIQTDQDKAALRSLFELKDIASSTQAELYFGPKAPAGKEAQWIKTLPGKGWFTYMRVYGPEATVFDGSWKPADIEEVKTPLATKPSKSPSTASIKNDWKQVFASPHPLAKTH